MENKQSENEEWDVIDLRGDDLLDDENPDEEYADEYDDEYDDDFDEDDYPDDDGRFDAYV